MTVAQYQFGFDFVICPLYYTVQHLSEAQSMHIK